MEANRKTIFISYSWDNTEHQEWVLQLAKDLMAKFGIIVILDQFELSAGKDLTYFMESAIEKADKVLVILTPNYKTKAENRKSGVGYETSMITQELFESPISKVKFMPILRIGKQAESAPKFLKSKVYHSMTDDKNYLKSIFELSRLIYDKPLIEKPELGAIPDLKTEKFDPILDIAKSVIDEEKLNYELNTILHSHEGVSLFNKETQEMSTKVVAKAEYYKTNSAIPFNSETNNRDTCIVRSSGFSVVYNWGTVYNNTTKEAQLSVRFIKGNVQINGGFLFSSREKPRTLKETVYNFDLDYYKNIIWKSKSQKDTTDEIIQNSFLFLIEKIKEEKSKNFRQ